MALAFSRTTVEKFSQANDPKKAILDHVGDLSGVEVLSNAILIAIYVRPEKTAGGIYRPGSNIQEDLWQGKAGLILKLGNEAFKDTDQNKFNGYTLKVGDWVAFRINDSWMLHVKNTPCRLVQDINIKLKLTDPSVVF